MRAAIHNPYLDTLGGGERYSLTVARVLLDKGYKVDVEWTNNSMKGKLEKRFNLELSDIKMVKDIKRGDGYDVCFWVSDGSIPLLRARNNILHFQFPFTNVNGNSLLNRMKFIRINSIVCNSKFTKKFIDKEYGVKSSVLYPPVDTDSFRSGNKENLIIYIGRFSQLTQAKRQDVLIDVFKSMYDNGMKKWKFVLAGGVEVGVDNYVNELRKSASGYPITILKSPSFNKLIDLYARAKIFWSATGYGIDEMAEPTKVEHFGISTVEALSSGVIPIVFSSGGTKEIIKHKENGYLWSDLKDLVSITENLANKEKLFNSMSKKSESSSKKYGYEKFSKNIGKYL